MVVAVTFQTMQAVVTVLSEIYQILKICMACIAMSQLVIVVCESNVQIFVAVWFNLNSIAVILKLVLIWNNDLSEFVGSTCIICKGWFDDNIGVIKITDWSNQNISRLFIEMKIMGVYDTFVAFTLIGSSRCRNMK